MGINSAEHATQTAYEYTSTRSIFTFNVGGLVRMTVTFLSPITPDDLTRSSLPYTYLEVGVKSADGKTHDVQLYTDITAGGSCISRKLGFDRLTISRMGFR